MTMGAMLAWPGVLGFVVLTLLVVALGTSSTARYEFEHNGTRERQRAGAPAQRQPPRRQPRRAGGPPAPRTPRRSPRRSTSPSARPRRRPPADRAGGWSTTPAQVVAGPFADRIDADWAALSGGLPAVSVHGIRRADGGVTPRPSPEERAFLGELGDAAGPAARTTGTTC